MKCKNCGNEMELLWETETTTAFLNSPEGHDHDDNCLVRTYKCRSCLKETNISKRKTCPACDWKGKLTCFCHDGEKVDEWPND